MATEKLAFRGLGDEAIDTIFLKARTHSVWQDRDVPDALIRQLHDTLKFGPTSANSCPARFLFVKSKEAKERLRPYLDEGNRERTMRAPVTAIIAHDLKFYEKLEILAPHNPAGVRSWFEGRPDKIRETAFRNGTLQGAYLIIAARALGLDCGPMSGFDPEGVKKEFFADNDCYPNFLCSFGYGDFSKVHPRAPRLNFDQSSKII